MSQPGSQPRSQPGPPPGLRRAHQLAQTVAECRDCGSIYGMRRAVWPPLITRPANLFRPQPARRTSLVALMSGCPRRGRQLPTPPQPKPTQPNPTPSARTRYSKPDTAQPRCGLVAAALPRCNCRREKRGCGDPTTPLTRGVHDTRHAGHVAKASEGHSDGPRLVFMLDNTPPQSAERLRLSAPPLPPLGPLIMSHPFASLHPKQRRGAYRRVSRCVQPFAHSSRRSASDAEPGETRRGEARQASAKPAVRPRRRSGRLDHIRLASRGAAWRGVGGRAATL